LNARTAAQMRAALTRFEREISESIEALRTGLQVAALEDDMPPPSSTPLIRLVLASAPEPPTPLPGALRWRLVIEGQGAEFYETEAAARRAARELIQAGVGPVVIDQVEREGPDTPGADSPPDQVRAVRRHRKGRARHGGLPLWARPGAVATAPGKVVAAFRRGGVRGAARTLPGVPVSAEGPRGRLWGPLCSGLTHNR
jgi:hypothetical protein